MIDADNEPLRTEESTHTDPDYNGWGKDGTEVCYG